jgi:serine O-acetyltransferase
MKDAETPCLRHSITLGLIVADLQRYYSLVHPKAPACSSFTLVKFLIQPRILPVLLYRISHFFYRYKLKSFSWLFFLANRLIHGIEIAAACKIGPGLFIPHTYGTVIGAFSIGANATVFQGATLGAKHLAFDFDTSTRPTLGDNVTIGSGAKVLGGISIGSNSIVGANSVVVSDVPSDCLVVGIPAMIKKSNNR